MNLPHNVLVERLTQHSQTLALPNGRRVGQPGHDVARKYLLQRMTDHAASAAPTDPSSPP